MRENSSSSFLSSESRHFIATPRITSAVRLLPFFPVPFFFVDFRHAFSRWDINTDHRLGAWNSTGLSQVIGIRISGATRHRRWGDAFGDLIRRSTWARYVLQLPNRHYGTSGHSRLRFVTRRVLLLSGIQYWLTSGSSIQRYEASVIPVK